MKFLVQFVFEVLCLGLFAAVCAGQVEMPQAAPAAANETNNFVQGKVVQDPGGQGIRKVKVSLRHISSPRPGNYETITDETGHFKIEGVEPGEYWVQLERAGYAAERKTNRGKKIKVSAGDAMKDLVFHMQAAGVILGKIVDLDGDPLRYVDVVAIAGPGGAATENANPSAQGATNDLGEYRIPDLAPGKYIVQATPQSNQVPLPSPNEKGTTKDRLIYVTTYFPGTRDQQQAAAVEVPAGGTATANFAVETSHAYRLSGTVIGVGSHAMTKLMLMGKNGQGGEQDLTEGGKFEFPNVLPGTYHVQLLTVSFGNGQAPSIKVQTIRTPIEVNSSDVVGLQLRMDPTGNVSGRFRMDGDEKMNWSELNVSLLTVAENEDEPAGSAIAYIQPAPVQEDGSFEMKDVPSANCQLAVGAGSEKFRDFYTKSVLLGGREVVDTGFAVTPGTVLDVVVSPKGAGIEGTVMDGEGKAVAGATVVTIPSSGKLGRPDAYQFVQADDSGHFVLRGMNPGEFRVLAFEEIPGNFRAPEFAKKYEAKGEKVGLEEGGKKSVVVKLIQGNERQ